MRSSCADHIIPLAAIDQQQRQSKVASSHVLGRKPHAKAKSARIPIPKRTLFGIAPELRIIAPKLRIIASELHSRISGKLRAQRNFPEFCPEFYPVTAFLLRFPALQRAAQPKLCKWTQEASANAFIKVASSRRSFLKAFIGAIHSSGILLGVD